MAPAGGRLLARIRGLLGADADWRLTVRFRSERQRTAALRALSERAAAALAEDRVKRLLSVRREGPWLRLYASSYDSIARAQAAIFSAVSEIDVSAEGLPEQFDQDRGDWVPVDAPLLSEIEAERISIHHGSGQWGAAAEQNRLTIHFECKNRKQALEMAAHLTMQGYEAHRHWTWVYVFVEDRDHADALLEHLDENLSRRAEVFVMGDGRTFFI